MFVFKWSFFPLLLKLSSASEFRARTIVFPAVFSLVGIRDFSLSSVFLYKEILKDSFKLTILWAFISIQERRNVINVVSVKNAV